MFLRRYGKSRPPVTQRQTPSSEMVTDQQLQQHLNQQALVQFQPVVCFVSSCCDLAPVDRYGCVDPPFHSQNSSSSQKMRFNQNHPLWTSNLTYQFLLFSITKAWLLRKQRFSVGKIYSPEESVLLEMCLCNISLLTKGATLDKIIFLAGLISDTRCPGSLWLVQQPCSLYQHCPEKQELQCSS